MEAPHNHTTTLELPFETSLKVSQLIPHHRLLRTGFAGRDWSQWQNWHQALLRAQTQQDKIVTHTLYWMLEELRQRTQPETSQEAYFSDKCALSLFTDRYQHRPDNYWSTPSFQVLRSLPDISKLLQQHYLENPINLAEYLQYRPKHIHKGRAQQLWILLQAELENQENLLTQDYHQAITNLDSPYSWWNKSFSSSSNTPQEHQDIIEYMSQRGATTLEEQIQFCAHRPKAIRQARAEQLQQWLSDLNLDLIELSPEALQLAQKLQEQPLVNRWQQHATPQIQSTYLPVRAEEIPSTFPELLNLIFSLIKDTLVNSKQWDILCHRLGLMGYPEKTLKEIGVSLGVTRERVRQLEKNTLQKVAAFFLPKQVHTTIDLLKKYTRKTQYHCHPVLQKRFLECFRLLQLPSSRWFSTWDRFVRRVETQLGQWPTEPTGWYRLFFRLNQTEVHPLKEITTTLIYRDQLKKKAREYLLKITESLPYLLSELSLFSVSKIEALAYLKKIDKHNDWTYDDLNSLLDSYPNLEDPLTGKLLIPNKVLSRQDIAYRTLFEHGKPLHFKELLEVLSKSNVHLNPSSFTNSLSNDKRVLPMGKSGYWYIAEWEGYSGKTIQELLIEILEHQQQPMSPEELLEQVTRQRPSSLASIHIYLSLKDDFQAYGINKWGLSHWSKEEHGPSWDSRGISEWVETQISAEETILFSELEQRFKEASGFTGRSARMRLAHAQALNSFRPQKWGATYVTLRPDWRNQEKTRRPKEENATLLHLLTQAVEDFLSDRIEHSAPLNLVVLELEEEFDDSHRATFYSYISKMEQVEKFNQDSNVWIRLKE